MGKYKFNPFSGRLDRVRSEDEIVNLAFTSGTLLNTSSGIRTTTVDFGTYTGGGNSVLRAGEAHFENVKIGENFGTGNYVIALDSNAVGKLRVGVGLLSSGTIELARSTVVLEKLTSNKIAYLLGGNTEDRPFTMKGSETAGFHVTMYGRRHGYYWHINRNAGFTGNVDVNNIGIMTINTQDNLLGFGQWNGNNTDGRPEGWDLNGVRSFLTISGKFNSTFGQLKNANDTLVRFITGSPHTGSFLEFTDTDGIVYQRISKTKYNINNIPTYADDASAGLAGLVTGDVYKTASGELRIKI